tara:strand:+ start:33362 stop:33571 length:210 start_codon:yes stop_codon:yes gene_type:complete
MARRDLDVYADLSPQRPFAQDLPGIADIACYSTTLIDRKEAGENCANAVAGPLTATIRSLSDRQVVLLV